MKTTWQHGTLLRARVRYPRRVALTVNPDAAFFTATARFMLADELAVDHDVKKRTLTLIPKPPEPEPDPQWWHTTGLPEPTVATLDGLYTSLEGFLREIDLTREGTIVGAGNGEITQVTVTYPKNTTRDTNEAFHGRVRRILAQKSHQPHRRLGTDLAAARGEGHHPARDPHARTRPDPAPPTPAPYLHALALGIRRTGQRPGGIRRSGPTSSSSGSPGAASQWLIGTLLVMALIAGWDVYLCDAKKVGYRRGFARGWGLSHERIATTGRHMESITMAVCVEMKRRYKLVEWGMAEIRDFLPLLLIVDENTEAIADMNAWAKKQYAKANPTKSVPRNLVSEGVDAEWSIARLGREVGVDPVLAHQRPDVRDIPGEARDNLTSIYAAGPQPARREHVLRHLRHRTAGLQRVFCSRMASTTTSRSKAAPQSTSATAPNPSKVSDP